MFLSFCLCSNFKCTMLLPALALLPELIARSSLPNQIKLTRVFHLFSLKLWTANWWMLVSPNTFKPLQAQHWSCIGWSWRCWQLILLNLVDAIMIVVIIIVVWPFLDKIKHFSSFSVLLFPYLFWSVTNRNLFDKVVFRTLEEIRSCEIFVSR